jgi:hypothetical protein
VLGGLQAVVAAPGPGLDVGVAVGNFLSTAKVHGIGITFEPDEMDWPVGSMKGMGDGPPSSAYDLETAARLPNGRLTSWLSAGRAGTSSTGLS